MSVLWLPLCGITGPGTPLNQRPSARRVPGDGEAVGKNVMAFLHRRHVLDPGQVTPLSTRTTPSPSPTLAHNTITVIVMENVPFVHVLLSCFIKLL